jgi:hypothetical protein
MNWFQILITSNVAILVGVGRYVYIKVIKQK